MVSTCDLNKRQTKLINTSESLTTVWKPFQGFKINHEFLRVCACACHTSAGNNFYKLAGQADHENVG